MDARTLPWQSQVRLPGRHLGQVMLLGGFGASPEPLRPLGSRLQAAGADVTIAALARHTGELAGFYGSRTWHYYAEAARDLRRLTANHDEPLILGGYSTGALVAILLAATEPPGLAGLVLISPVLRTASASKQLAGYSFGSLYYVGLPMAMLAATLAIVVRARRSGAASSSTALRLVSTTAVIAASALGLRNITVPLRSGGPMEVDGQWVVPPHYERASLLAGSTLVPLQLAARRSLTSVTVPACVVFGAADDVVDVEFGARLAGRMPAGQVHVVAGAPHRVVAYRECQDRVTEFVTRLLAP
jgi:pimeloyl-ACP methyl ester carboxylesterase